MSKIALHTEEVCEARGKGSGIRLREGEPKSERRAKTEGEKRRPNESKIEIINSKVVVAGGPPSVDGKGPPADLLEKNIPA